VARAKKTVDEIEAFRAALGAVRGRTARSSLYRWLRAYHDQFLEDWTEAADWPAFSEAFARLGLTDRTGKSPIPETARKTWLQVRKDVAKAKTRQMAKRAPALAPGEIAPGVRAVETPARIMDDAPRPRMTLDIRPSRPHVETSAPEITAAPSQPLAPDPETPPDQISSAVSKGRSLTDEEVAANLRLLTDRLNSRKVPIPKPI
jgi:hypothetical protein